jgi:hypothetical protein
MRTIYNTTLARIALTYAVRSANSAVNGTAVDLGVFNNNFRSVQFIITTGTLTDGAVAFTIEESDVSGSGYAAVPADRIQGTLPTTAATDDDTVFQVGCVPNKRYVRLVATTSGATSGGGFSAVAILAGGSNVPPARA